MLKAELSAGKMGVKIDSLICGNPTSKIIISNDGTVFRVFFMIFLLKSLI
ncbi:hypothetical protein EFM7_0517 [Enterococcus faecalis M7]|nr:hypothetical protein EFM7_0517 [Enterococcus faecalis M7]OSH12800.1 hypothetical protein EFDM72_1359 [Enterococcus faecalis]